MTIRTQFSIAVAAFALVTAIAPAGAADVLPTKQVDVGMFNLASAQGLSHAQALIRAAAKSVCDAGGSTITDRSQQLRCTKAAIEAGYARLGAVRTAQIASAKGERLASN